MFFARNQILKKKKCAFIILKFIRNVVLTVRGKNSKKIGYHEIYREKLRMKRDKLTLKNDGNEKTFDDAAVQILPKAGKKAEIDVVIEVEEKGEIEIVSQEVVVIIDTWKSNEEDVGDDIESTRRIKSKKGIAKDSREIAREVVGGGSIKEGGGGGGGRGRGRRNERKKEGGRAHSNKLNNETDACIFKHTIAHNESNFNSQEAYERMPESESESESESTSMSMFNLKLESSSVPLSLSNITIISDDCVGVTDNSIGGCYGSNTNTTIINDHNIHDINCKIDNCYSCSESNDSDDNNDNSNNYYDDNNNNSSSSNNNNYRNNNNDDDNNYNNDDNYYGNNNNDINNNNNNDNNNNNNDRHDNNDNNNKSYTLREKIGILMKSKNTKKAEISKNFLESAKKLESLTNSYEITEKLIITTIIDMRNMSINRRNISKSNNKNDLGNCIASNNEASPYSPPLPQSIFPPLSRSDSPSLTVSSSTTRKSKKASALPISKSKNTIRNSIEKRRFNMPENYKKNKASTNMGDERINSHSNTSNYYHKNIDEIEKEKDKENTRIDKLNREKLKYDEYQRKILISHKKNMILAENEMKPNAAILNILKLTLKKEIY